MRGLQGADRRSRRSDVDNPLHRARLQRDLDLAELNARTMLGMGILLKIDQGRFSELPAGIYARAYVRAFASAVGLDASAVIAELTPRLPNAPDPFPLIREAKETAARRRRSRSAPPFDDVLVDGQIGAGFIVRRIVVPLIQCLGGGS